jgi:cation transporter-like permease
MGIGGGIFLIVVGAVLAFAVSDAVQGVDLAMIGYICMAAGVLTVIIALVMNAQRTNTTHREVIERRDEGRPPAPPTY